jgi:small subunit ribosomal protein S6e
MAEFKLVLSSKDGKSYQREVKDKEAIPFLGKKIGDKIAGDGFGLAGYEVEITGGSDYCGFPMRKDVQGTGRKRILAVAGVGLKKKGKGQRQRKTVCGNAIHGRIAQVNLKILKEGKEKLGAKKEDKVEEKPAADKPEKKEQPKEDAPKEEKPKDKPNEEAPKDEKPKEDKSDEAKPKEEVKKS